jgi:hypothetical protein
VTASADHGMTSHFWNAVAATAASYIVAGAAAGEVWLRLHPPLMSEHWADPGLILQPLLLGIAVARRWPIVLTLLLGLAAPLAWVAFVSTRGVAAELAWVGSHTGGVLTGAFKAWLAHVLPPALASTATALWLLWRRAQRSAVDSSGATGGA